MWTEIIKHLPSFDSAVLNGVDPNGYPFSLRCAPQPDSAQQLLVVSLPKYVPIQPGPASLLCHTHDELMQGLKSFVVIGMLEQSPEGWLFRPRRFIPGPGTGGVWGMIKFIRDGRRATNRYLAQRGLARPQVDWHHVKELWAEALAQPPKSS
jgi:hypothetical protein